MEGAAEEGQKDHPSKRRRKAAAGDKDWGSPWSSLAPREAQRGVHKGPAVVEQNARSTWC